MSSSSDAGAQQRSQEQQHSVSAAQVPVGELEPDAFPLGMWWSDALRSHPAWCAGL